MNVNICLQDKSYETHMKCKETFSYNERIPDVGNELHQQRTHLPSTLNFTPGFYWLLKNIKGESEAGRSLTSQ